MTSPEYPSASATGVCQYVCYSRIADARYISVNMFRNLFGDRYAKPLYIEKRPDTMCLDGRCCEKVINGRRYFSLIKDSRGMYRYNRTIYEDAHRILQLNLVTSPGLSYGLMHVAPSELEAVIDPRMAFLAALSKNAALPAVIKACPAVISSRQEALGLIGSLSVDASAIARDIDLVFNGPIQWLNQVHAWLRQDDHSGPPLRRKLGGSLPTICAFFDAIPSCYGHLSNLIIQDATEVSCSVTIKKECWPTYLNVQVFRAECVATGSPIQVIIRDTLGRDMLMVGTHVKLFGLLGTLHGDSAILVTDVETQLPGIRVHGGGSLCD